MLGLKVSLAFSSLKISKEPILQKIIFICQEDIFRDTYKNVSENKFPAQLNISE